MKTIRSLGLGAAVVLVISAAASSARATDVRLGAEIGVGRRAFETPGYNPGLAIGGSIEVAPIPVLFVGPYYLRDTVEATAGHWASTFDAVGARARLVLPFPLLRPYAFAGIGAVFVSHPEVGSTPARGGRFFETPVGGGLALQLGGRFQVGADFTVRPAFAFRDAKPPPLPLSKESSYWGWTLLGGAALVL